jgi:predicted nucleic acid-binding protein
LAKYEVGNALLKKGLTSSQAYQSLGTVYSLPIQFITETDNLASQTYQMASQAQAAGHLKVTYYDASFTALAKQENAVLITDNPKHQALISGVKVIPLKDY